MGVVAVDVMRHAAHLHGQQRLTAGYDRPSRALHSRSTPLHRRQLRRSFDLPTAPCRTIFSKPRRLAVRRGVSTVSPLALNRPFYSVTIAPTITEAAAAEQLLHSSLELKSSAMAAPASGAQPLQIVGFDHCGGDDDRPLDYKEAAAALEQLFTESPSLEIDHIFDVDLSTGEEREASSSLRRSVSPQKRSKAGIAVVASTRKGSRKDLMARITLRKKRLMGGERRDSIRRGNRRKIEAAEAILEPQEVVIWSEAASKLLRQHGQAVNLMAQNWDKLGGELLSMEEERWLALLMKPAMALQKVKVQLEKKLGRDATDDEWAQAVNMDMATLSRQLALHHAARNKLVKLNLRLVRQQAGKYEREALSSLTAVELCQEGVKGLIMAVDRFDPTRGVRFCTYAIFWIRNAILRAQIRSGYPIRAPFNFAEIKMNINKVKWEMRLEGGEAGDRKAKEMLMKRMLERTGLDEERYKTVMQSNRRVVSLHKRVTSTGAELIEHLADPKSDSDAISGYLVGSGVTDPSLRLGLDDVLDSLKPKESLVLRQRFGLDGKGERALGEIGRNMRISREMVRRYEAQGLLKLKHPKRLDYLRSFLPQNS